MKLLYLVVFVAFLQCQTLVHSDSEKDLFGDDRSVEDISGDTNGELSDSNLDPLDLTTDVDPSPSTMSTNLPTPTVPPITTKTPSPITTTSVPPLPSTDTYTTGSTPAPTTPPAPTTTTTTATTTALPIPTTTPADKDTIAGYDSIRNVTCILLKMKASFLIDYVKADNEKAQQSVNFRPYPGVISANCGPYEQEITVHWIPEKANQSLDEWMLRLTFKLDNGSSSGYLLGRKLLNLANEKQSIFLSSVSMQYQLDPRVFDRPENPYEAVGFASDVKLFSVSPNEYYRCNAKLTSAVNNATKLVTTDMEVNAFRNNNQHKFDGSESVCPEDSSSQIVPIIVGVVLGVLVIAVLVAYFIGRRRQHQGYERY